MNNIATAALAVVLAAGAGFAVWRATAPGPQYAKVVHATPVTVREPRFVDVVEVVPVMVPRAGRKPLLAYDVSYREDGGMHRMRLARDPGDQVGIGERRRVIGYDVTWRWRNRTGVVRMSAAPGKRLPVVDGRVVDAHPSIPRPAPG